MEKKNVQTDLESIREAIGGYAFKISTAMLALASACEDVINRYDAEVLREMKRVSDETFSQAFAAIEKAKEKIQ